MSNPPLSSPAEAPNALATPAPDQMLEHERGAARPRRVQRVLILVENLPSPFDRRVWQEATTLCRAGYEVSIICPTGKGYEARYEVLEGIHIHRYPLPIEAAGALGYALEYALALAWTLWFTARVLFTRGFDVIHACNPPDLFFLIGGLAKLLGKKFIFDHHDLNPELYEAKFGRRDFFYRLMLGLLPSTVLTAWSLVVLLVIGWRHRTEADSRLAGVLSATGVGLAGLVQHAAAQRLRERSSQASIRSAAVSTRRRWACRVRRGWNAASGRRKKIRIWRYAF